MTDPKDYKIGDKAQTLLGEMTVVEVPTDAQYIVGETMHGRLPCPTCKAPADVECECPAAEYTVVSMSADTIQIAPRPTTQLAK